MLFSNICLSALNILDHHTIVRYECPAGRYFYRVNYPDRSYQILFHSASCTCPFYLGGEGMCKHILAVSIADALAKYRVEMITNEDYADCMQN
jgi:predicted nucleic acid-binding Zn finger protein